MSLLEIILLSLSVSIDIFPVAVCKGAGTKSPFTTSLICSLWFCTFQILMLVLGFSVSYIFAGFVDTFDHWIVFFIFLIFGLKMVRESFSKSENNNTDLKIKTMFPLSIATSIDSMMIGVSVSLFESNIFVFASVIAVFTLIFTFLGIFVGFKFGKKFKKSFGIFGGLLLIFIGIKVLIEHLFF